jgi:hypothetical protein
VELINEEGFTFEEIRSLFLTKDGNKLVAENMIPLKKSRKSGQLGKYSLLAQLQD